MAAGTLVDQLCARLLVSEAEARFIITSRHVSVDGDLETRPAVVVRFGSRVWVGVNFFSDSQEWVA